MHHILELEGYHFAITEFMLGITLRSFLLSNSSHDISLIMHEVGTMLSKITAHAFPEAGFLDKDFKVTPYEPSDFIKFLQDCFNDQTVLSVLG